MYALQLLAALMDYRPDWEYWLYTRDERQSVQLEQQWPHVNPKVLAVPGSPNTWRLQVKLPGRLRSDKIDVYHSLGYFLPLAWHGRRVVTIHDLNVYLSWRSWMRRTKFAQWADMAVQTPFALIAADRIIAVSQFSKASISKMFKVSPSKITVVPNAPDAYFDAPSTQSEIDEVVKLTGGMPFVLFVGILSAQKNLQSLIRAFSQSGLAGENYRLVLAGSDREGEGANLRRLARREGIDEKVLLPGFVSLAVLRALYHKALCLVLPSHAEGFGLTMVEAMASGTPVIAANTQALPEVAGDAAALVDPNDLIGLANQMSHMARDLSFREELVERGKLRRQRFSWRAAAEATAAVYEEIYNNRR